MRSERMKSLMNHILNETVLGELLAPVSEALARLRNANANTSVLDMYTFIGLGVLRHLQGMPSLSAYAALGSDALGIAIGESQRSQLPSALEPTEGDNALMHYGLNFEGYSKVMSTLMNRMAEQLQEANPESDMVQAADAMNILGEIYEYSGATVFLTERGIEVRSMTRLAPQ